ncbi:unnamed protein product [Cyprideis torosa]|uniref:Dynactin subunit 5 n=1 Tax=Cyprideis torosa TaxID=163714 RepID=A0A7R8WCR1_9CRUS|nr:unnamed protein product [Cyprideis torosa]CAG0888216.1 unnamed protein product [Cyprideis torosa]
MEMEEKYYNKSEYIETTTGNKVSRKTVLFGSQNIVLSGKNIVMAQAVIRADLANIRTGRHCVIREGVIIRSPFKRFSKGGAFFPVSIGEHVYIGEGTVVNAAKIGSFVYIGRNCVIGRRSVLRDCCYIADNTFVPPETEVAPFTHLQGSPAVANSGTNSVPECMEDLMTDYTKSFYKKFKPLPKDQSSMSSLQTV